MISWRSLCGRDRASSSSGADCPTDDLEPTGQGLLQVDGCGVQCREQQVVLLGQVDREDRLRGGCRGGDRERIAGVGQVSHQGLEGSVLSDHGVHQEPRALQA